MRHHPRLDANQKAIVDALRAYGCTVRSLASVGSGCPDLLVGHRDINYLLEVKNPKRKHAAEYVAAESFASSWKGSVSLVTDIESALLAVGIGR